MNVRGFTLAAVAALFGNSVWAQEGPVEKKKDGMTVEDKHVIITASRLEEDPKDVASSATVIGEGTLNRAQQRRVFDALREVPALDVVQTGAPGSRTSVYIRGANSEHTLVLVDGVEVNDAASGGRSFDFAHLTADNIERIEVIRGPQSVLYGSDALGGVIQIFTRRGRGEPKLKLMSEAGSFGTYRGRASISDGTEKVTYSLAASRIESQGFSAASSDFPGNSEKDGYQNATFSTRIGITPVETFELDLTARHTDGRSELDNGGGAFQDDPNHVSEFDQWSVKAEPQLTLFDGVWQQSLGVKLSRVERNIENLPDTLHPGELEFSSFDSRGVDLDWQHDFHFGESHTLTVGGEFEEDTASTSFHSDGMFGPFTSIFEKKSAWTRGAYLQERIHLWDRFTATVGGRVDDHEEFGSHATWRMTGAYFHECTRTKFRGTVGSGFKSPSLFQLFSSFGDPRLEAEESLGWDAGVDQEVLGDLASISLTVFGNRFEELILFDGGLSRFVNIGRAESEGLEVAARIRPLEALELSLSYTYTDTREKGTDQDLLRRPNHKGGVRITGFLSEHLTATAAAHYIGDREDNDFSTFPATRVTLDDMWLSSIALSFRILEDVELFGRVENVFDQEYEEVFGFGVAGAAGYLGASITF